MDAEGERGRGLINQKRTLNEIENVFKKSSHIRSRICNSLGIDALPLNIVKVRVVGAESVKMSLTAEEIVWPARRPVGCTTALGSGGCPGLQ